jgi:APA family basic amino acid/polyamine antiporter
MLVTAGAIGSIGGAPIMGADGVPLSTGSEALARQCALPQHAEALVCSGEPLAHVLRTIGFGAIGNMLGYAAFIALPSVILILIFGLTRICFVMGRDGLLPERLATVHPKWKTPHVVTIITGSIIAVLAALFPVGQLADIANAGTLYAFAMVAIAVWTLRRRDPDRRRPFRAPALWLVAPLTVLGCLFLFLNLPKEALIGLPLWGGIGLLVYFLYGYRMSHLGRGLVEVHESEIHDIEPSIPGVDERDAQDPPRRPPGL